MQRILRLIRVFGLAAERQYRHDDRRACSKEEV
jgi:hypothetical protein